MKFIVEYEYGDMECSCTNTVAFDYSSKEELLLEIERMANQYIKDCQSNKSEENCLEQKKLADSFFSHKTITADEYIAARKKYDIPNPIFKHNGYQLTISQFVDYNPDVNIHYFYYPPSVYTVDEWFAHQLSY